MSPTNQLCSLDVLNTSSLPGCWQAVLNQPQAQQKLPEIRQALRARLAQGLVVFPQDPWRALRLTPLEDVKVVILGQDPYHGPNQAQGLAFSVDDRCPPPPSLRNIFKELHQCLPNSTNSPTRHDLTPWAQQGVLLLNTVLTVEQGRPASHAALGWQFITDLLIRAVALRPKSTVFMLWGKHAQGKRALIESNQDQGNRSSASHLILQANHPSPLSATRPPIPFIGSRPFVLCNDWLLEQGLPPINW